MSAKGEIHEVKRNTKEKIINAAIELFSKRGVNAVSIRDITKQVGINESSLYNHFKGKDELLDSIIEIFRCELGEASFPEDRIEEMLEGVEPEMFFQHHLFSLRERITPAVQMIWKIIYMEQFSDKRARDFVINEIIGRPARYYEKVFSVMAEKGMIKPVDPGLLSDEINYSWLALSLERMLRQTDGEDITPIARKMFAHIKFVCDAVKK